MPPQPAFPPSSPPRGSPICPPAARPAPEAPRSLPLYTSTASSPTPIISFVRPRAIYESPARARSHLLSPSIPQRHPPRRSPVLLRPCAVYEGPVRTARSSRSTRILRLRSSAGSTGLRLLFFVKAGRCPSYGVWTAESIGAHRLRGSPIVAR